MLARTSGFGPPCEAHQAHFAGDVASGRVAMDPLEHLRLAGRREFRVLARRNRWLPIGLHLGADRVQMRREQLIACHLEQPQGRFVRLDEALRIRIDDGDGFRRVVDQGAVTRLTVAQGFLRAVALGDVAQADDEHFATAMARAAHGDLRRERRAVAAPRGDFGAHAHAAERVARFGEPGEAGRDGTVDRDARHEHIDALT